MIVFIPSIRMRKKQFVWSVNIALVAYIYSALLDSLFAKPLKSSLTRCSINNTGLTSVYVHRTLDFRYSLQNTVVRNLSLSGLHFCDMNACSEHLHTPYTRYTLLQNNATKAVTGEVLFQKCIHLYLKGPYIDTSVQQCILNIPRTYVPLAQNFNM